MSLVKRRGKKKYQQIILKLFLSIEVPIFLMGILRARKVSQKC